MDIARRNNPAYRQILNDRTPASRSLLNATTSMFTPTVSLNGNYYWSDAGQRFVQGTTLSYNGPTSSQTAGSLNLRYSLSGATFTNRGLAAAELRATDQDIEGAEVVLTTTIRSQYLNTLEAQAQAGVARRALERVSEQLNLAQARYSVGQGTLIDVRRAQVDKGTAEVTLLRNDQAAENQTLILYNQMGIPAPTVPRLQLTDSFPVVAPAWNIDTLLNFAAAQNPQLLSLRARESSARWSTRAARSEYLPSLFFSAGTGRTGFHTDAFSQPDPANPGTFIPIPARTEWSTDPWGVSVGMSLPIYDAFSRYARTASAAAREDDMRQQVRARELQVRSDVVAAFNSLQAAFVAVGLQETNKSASAEALELATQRYRVGSGSYLELLDARTAADRADTDYITAVYAYHRAIATLEQAVGRPLR
jgi:outer membrane protein